MEEGRGREKDGHQGVEVLSAMSRKQVGAVQPSFSSLVSIHERSACKVLYTMLQ